MQAILLSVLVIASDFYARRVPNAWLMATMLAAIVTMVAGMLFGTDKSGWLSVLGLVLGLFVTLPFYAIGMMGAGDVKFFALLGFLLGAHALLPIWITGTLLIGVHAIVMLVLRHMRPAYASFLAPARERLMNSAWWQRIHHARQGRVGLPYAAYLGIGTLMTVLMPHTLPWSTP